MEFSEALNMLKEGFLMKRTNWNGKGMYIQIQSPDKNSKMTRAYIYINIPEGSSKQFEAIEGVQRVPWLPSQTDLLSNDWEIEE